MGKWKLVYPKFAGTEQQGRDMYNAAVEADYTNWYNDDDDGTLTYTLTCYSFARNPTRIDYNIKYKTTYYKIPFSDTATALGFGLQPADIVLLITFKNSAEVAAFEKAVRKQYGWSGQEAMATSDPSVAPMILFEGASNRRKFVFPDGYRIVREGMKGEIRDVEAYFKNWKPHLMTAAKSLTYQENLTFNGVDKSANTVLWMPGMAGVNQQVADASGNGNHGTIYGAARVDTPFGPGLSFDGVDDYVEASDSSSLDFSGEFSNCYWVKPNSLPAQEAWLVSKGGGWNRAGFFTDIVSDGSLRFGMGDGITETLVGNSTVFTAGVWTHIVVTYSGNTMKAYKNGVPLSNTATNSYNYVNNYPVRIGLSDYSSLFPFNGTIAGATILNVALSSAEVLDKYNTEKALLAIANAGNVYSKPSQIKVTGVTETDYVDQRQTTGGWALNFGQVAPNPVRRAQSFKPTKENATKVVFYPANLGTGPADADTITISIQGDSSGSPSGTTLASTTQTGVQWKSKVTSGLPYILSLPYKLTPNTTYWIVFSSSGANDINVPSLQFNGGANVYPEGVNKYYNGTTWVDGGSQLLRFATYFANHTYNLFLYDDGDEDAVFRIGRESADQKQEYDDNTVGMNLDAANDWCGSTFQPAKAKLSKVMLRCKTTGNPGNMRVRLFEYNTTTNTYTGSALATSYVSPSEASTTKGDIYVPLEYNSLDTTKTYIIIADDDNGGASDYWTIYGFTTSGLGDSSAGRQVNSTNGGTAWTESTTIQHTFKTYYPDATSTHLSEAAYIQVSDDATGELLIPLVQANASKDIAAAYSINGTAYDYTDLEWDIDDANDSVTWKISSPYPMKNCEIDTITINATGRIKLEASTDNSTWTVFKVFDNNLGKTYTDILLPTAFDNQNIIYIRATAIGTNTANYINDMDFYANVDTGGAMLPQIETGTATWKMGSDELGSGRAKIDMYYSERS